MSDEEREAISHLTEKMKYHKDNPLGTYVWLTLDEHYVRTILNLIEKQQKEIVHWKAGMKIIEKDKNNHIERLERRIEELDSENEVLEEIKISYEKKTDKLLKEKVKKEKEIEELKEQCKEVVCVPEGTCFMITPKDIDKKWEDKIKAKIEELNDLNSKFAQRVIKGKEVYLTEMVQNILQSLLEKE